jgi:type VI protein secretion system component VasK
VTRKLRLAPAPLEANDRLVTAVITAAWVIGLISVLVLRQHLTPSQRWWVWTSAVGVCMGLFGLWYVPRLKRSRTRTAERRTRARAEAEAEAERGGGQS